MRGPLWGHGSGEMGKKLPATLCPPPALFKACPQSPRALCLLFVSKACFSSSISKAGILTFPFLAGTYSYECICGYWIYIISGWDSHFIFKSPFFSFVTLLVLPIIIIANRIMVDNKY